MGVIDRLVVIVWDNLLTLLTIQYCHYYISLVVMFLPTETSKQ